MAEQGHRAEVLDHISAPYNACSLESLQQPIQLPHDDQLVWPVVTSCYELESSGSRRGHLDLHLVSVPQSPSDPVKFGESIISLNSKHSGILDGKWYPKTSTPVDNKWWYATAQSSGQVALHNFSIGTPKQEDDDVSASTKPTLVSGTTSSSKPLTSNGGDPVLCLSVSWDTYNGSSSSDTARIVSSYSNGKVAIHDIIIAGNTPEFVERDIFVAHTMPMMGDIPSEVWTCAFGAEGQVVMTGGDDATLKFWDTRVLNRPMQSLKKEFEAGVTVISPHPRDANVVAIGSYDETISIFDIRYHAQKPLSKSDKMGGGIWRIQWHPIKDDKLLLAAMHGGCRVVQLDADQRAVVVKEFTEHTSMAYGADWLVHGQMEAAASCSFYDKAMYLWDTKVLSLAEAKQAFA